jgi:uncharacterized protein
MTQDLPTGIPYAPLQGWTRDGSPFHPGERAVQERAGVRERSGRAGRRAIRDFMPDQHRELFEKLPFLIVGSLDERRRPWGSIVAGQPGFIASPDSRALEIHARPVIGDPGAANLAPGAPVGLLGIQLETRRRNRANGTVVRAEEAGFVVRVGQSFGNCPQYIQARNPVFVASPEALKSAPRRLRAEGAALSAAAVSLIERADTFFIVTAAPSAGGDDPVEGVDVSHRGGKPGFVRVATAADGSTTLTSPDFAGNRYFNTLGNLVLNPRAGLLFVDFASGGVLSLTGEAEAIWDGPELAAFAGAERLLRFRVADGVWIEEAVPLRWSAPTPAPQLEATGSWQDLERTKRVGR